MVQTIVVVLMILAGAWFVQANVSALAAPINIAVPGTAGVTLSVLEVILVAVAALVIVWLAGQIDTALMAWRIRRREPVLRTTQHEVDPTGAPVYDRQPSVMYVSLTHIHKRLDAIEQQLEALRERLDTARGTTRGTGRMFVRNLR